MHQKLYISYDIRTFLMIRLILLGVLSGAFFSSTFILNEVMSVSGGHWLWSASLDIFL